MPGERFRPEFERALDAVRAEKEPLDALMQWDPSKSLAALQPPPKAAAVRPKAKQPKKKRVAVKKKRPQRRR
jgi:hypothetical protein